MYLRIDFRIISFSFPVRSDAKDNKKRSGQNPFRFLHLKRHVFRYSNNVNSFKPIHFFIHPLPLFAVVLTAVNDHYFKYLYPGLLTGKLSDFTGLFYFPLFVCALVVVVMRLIRKDFVFNRGLLLTAIILTDVVFCVMKLNSGFKDLFVQWFSHYVFTIAVYSDSTDLIALSVSLLCYFFGARFFAAKTIAA